MQKKIIGTLSTTLIVIATFVGGCKGDVEGRFALARERQRKITVGANKNKADHFTIGTEISGLAFVSIVKKNDVSMKFADARNDQCPIRSSGLSSDQLDQTVHDRFEQEFLFDAFDPLFKRYATCLPFEDWRVLKALAYQKTGYNSEGSSSLRIGLFASNVSLCRLALAQYGYDEFCGRPSAEVDAMQAVVELIPIARVVRYSCPNVDEVTVAYFMAVGFDLGVSTLQKILAKTSCDWRAACPHMHELFSTVSSGKFASDTPVAEICGE